MWHFRIYRPIFIRMWLLQRTSGQCRFVKLATLWDINENSLGNCEYVITKYDHVGLITWAIIQNFTLHITRQLFLSEMFENLYFKV